MIDPENIEEVIDAMEAFMESAGDDPVVEIRVSRINAWTIKLAEAIANG